MKAAIAVLMILIAGVVIAQETLCPIDISAFEDRVETEITGMLIVLSAVEQRDMTREVGMTTLLRSNREWFTYIFERSPSALLRCGTQYWMLRAMVDEMYISTLWTLSSVSVDGNA